MLGPDGAPAEGIALWLLDDSTNDFNFRKFVPVSSDGTFEIVYGDGAFTIHVWTWGKQGGAAQWAGTAARGASLPTVSRRP